MAQQQKPTMTNWPHSKTQQKAETLDPQVKEFKLSSILIQTTAPHFGSFSLSSTHKITWPGLNFQKTLMSSLIPWSKQPEKYRKINQKLSSMQD